MVQAKVNAFSRKWLSLGYSITASGKEMELALLIGKLGFYLGEEGKGTTLLLWRWDPPLARSLLQEG